MTTRQTKALEPNETSLDTARENLRIACAKRHLNYAEVSRQAGMSRNGLQQFISGRTSLSYNNMLQVCKVLQLPICLVHQPDAITDQKIRLYQAIYRLPDHLLGAALAEAEKTFGRPE